VLVVLKAGSLNIVEQYGFVQACNGIALPLPFTVQVTVRDALLDHLTFSCIVNYSTVEAAYYGQFGARAFDNNNRLIALSGGYKNLHYLAQFIVTTFYMYKNNKIYLENLCSASWCLFAFSSS
jgi:hypothetical protein